MPTGADNKDINNSTLSTKDKLVLPAFPQENQILSHQAFKWHERAIRELTVAGLFKVATMAAMPDSIEEVRDRPVPGALPATHRDYARREEKIMDITEHNVAQPQRRFSLANCTRKGSGGLGRNKPGDIGRMIVTSLRADAYILYV